MPLDENAVVKCFGCGKWYRVAATDSLGTIEEGEVPVNVRWCLNCIEEIDGNTRNVIEDTTEYPQGLPQWDLEEGPDEQENDE